MVNAAPLLSVPTPPPRTQPGKGALGDVRQYKHSPSLLHADGLESVTGATLADPSRKRVSQPLTRDPDWASPMRWFARPLEEFGTSIAIYWLGYGGLQLAVVLLAGLVTGQGEITHFSMGLMLAVGPLFAAFTDIILAAQGGWALPFGILGFLCEPVLFMLFFFSTEWVDRFKCMGLLLVLVVIRAVVLSFA